MASPSTPPRRWRLITPRQWLRQWWLARLPATEEWTLTQRNIYIVPTRAGLAFAGTLLVLLVASINYQLNLGYALTFLLAGSALASMHMTHGSLRGLRLHFKPPAPVFCGEPAQLEIIIDNPGGSACHGLGLCWNHSASTQKPVWADVPARSQTSWVLSLLTEQRGRLVLPVLRLHSSFPFGLFRAWTVWRPAGAVWVYPQPEHPAPRLPLASATEGEGATRRETQGGEFDGVRPWRRGDSLRQVVWKKVARSGELVSRDTQTTARQQLWLDWEGARLYDTEARLSRLASWVMQAHEQGLPYGLRLPGRTLPCADGLPQRQAALLALAQWGHTA